MSEVIHSGDLGEDRETLEKLRSEGYSDCTVTEVSYDTKTNRYKVTIEYPGTHTNRKASYKVNVDLVEFISVNKIQSMGLQQGIVLSKFSNGRLDLVVVKY